MTDGCWRIQGGCKKCGKRYTFLGNSPTPIARSGIIMEGCPACKETRQRKAKEMAHLKSCKHHAGTAGCTPVTDAHTVRELGLGAALKIIERQGDMARIHPLFAQVWKSQIRRYGMQYASLRLAMDAYLYDETDQVRARMTLVALSVMGALNEQSREAAEDMMIQRKILLDGEGPS